jgi:tellurium resistance protein TerD
VVVGVAIHRNHSPKTFGDVSNAGVLVVEGYRELLKDDFTQVSGWEVVRTHVDRAATR